MVVSAIVLGIYWFFVAPRIERAPRWFRIGLITIGGALILALVIAVTLGLIAKAA